VRESESRSGSEREGLWSSTTYITLGREYRCSIFLVSLTLKLWKGEKRGRRSDIEWIRQDTNKFGIIFISYTSESIVCRSGGFQQS
jgi:hypothetical protein